MMDVSKFKINEGEHNNSNVLWIAFDRNNELLDLLRQNLKVRWSASNKSWYALDNNFNREKLGLQPKLIGKEVFLKIHEVNLPALQKLENELRIRAYSENTIKTYLREFAQLLYILKGHPVDTLTPERIKSYLLYCLTTLKNSENHVQSRLNAIKFYFEKVLKHPQFFIDIPRPKSPKQLPKVIGSTSIKKMLSSIENQKHLLMIQLCYGMGLRVSEIVGLQISDIDSDRMQVHIRNAKGKKDRYVPLPNSVLENLRAYYIQFKPKTYLFEGMYGGKYSVRSVQSVFKKALETAKINKKVGVHSLRHSYATHLMEMGTDISLIKELLGHNDIKTTLIYTHISQKSILNVKSPLDNI